jgi:hypothetical protein
MSLSWSYWISGLTGVATWLIVAGGLWLLGEWRRASWIASLALLFFVGAAAAGLWIGLPPSLMVIGAVAGLLGWDLSGFARRMRRASRTDDLHGIEMRHLARAAIVAAIALVIAGITAFFRIRIPFELAVLLAIMGAMGLTRLVFWIQRENDL